MPLYVSSNKDKDAQTVNILFTKMRKGRDTTASSKTYHVSYTASQRVTTRRRKCALIVMTSTFTVREL